MRRRLFSFYKGFAYMDINLAALHTQPPHIIEAFPRHAACLLYAQQSRLLVTTGMEPVVRIWNSDTWSLAG